MKQGWVFDLLNWEDKILGPAVCRTYGSADVPSALPHLTTSSAGSPYQFLKLRIE